MDGPLATTAIFLTFLAIVIPIAAFFIGRFSFQKLNEIKEEAQSYVEDIKSSHKESQSILEKQKEELAENVPFKTGENEENRQKDPGSSQVNQAVAAALRLQQHNKIEEALEKWRSIANITEGIDNKRAAEAWFSVGYLSSPQNAPGEDFEGAILAYSKAIELNLGGPNLYWAYFNRGNAKFSFGQIEAAIADYDEAIGLSPGEAAAYHNRGNAKSRLGQIVAAIADYDEAISLKPGEAAAYHNRGNAKSRLGQIVAAIADFDKAISLKPGEAAAYHNRGNAKSRLGQIVAAIADFDKAISLDQSYFAVYLSRGNAKLQLNRKEEAMQDFNMALWLAREAGDKSLVELAGNFIKNVG